MHGHYLDYIALRKYIFIRIFEFLYTPISYLNFIFFLTFLQRYLISPDFSQSPPNPYITASYCILKGDIGLGGGKEVGYPITFHDFQGNMILEIETVCKKILVFRMN